MGCQVGDDYTSWKSVSLNYFVPFLLSVYLCTTTGFDATGFDFRLRSREHTEMRRDHWYFQQRPLIPAGAKSSLGSAGVREVD